MNKLFKKIEKHPFIFFGTLLVIVIVGASIAGSMSNNATNAANQKLKDEAMQKLNDERQKI